MYHPAVIIMVLETHYDHSLSVDVGILIQPYVDIFGKLDWEMKLEIFSHCQIKAFSNYPWFR